MTPEPTRVADAIPPTLRAHIDRLAAQGLDVSPQPPEPNRETEQERDQRLANRRAAIHRRWLSQIPFLYRDACWDDLDPEQRFRWPDDSLNLLLAGPVGTGKTHAAYAVGNAQATLGRVVQAVTVIDLLEAMRPDGNADLARAAFTCQVLILDDLGATKATDFAVEQMTALLDTRIREDRRTIVTTNSREDELLGAWGTRFMDRLRYRSTVHVFRGQSRRGGAW